MNSSPGGAVPPVMRALRQPSSTGPHDLHLVTDAPVPVPGPGEVLVRVSAAGVNFADVMQTHGTYGDGPTAPYIAGFEAAGEVVAVGPGPGDLEVGAHVIGTGPGAFAEYMVMAAGSATRVPPGWTDEQALGLVLNWATALAALRPLGRVAAGETVLVHAAAGGVGQAAVRLAKHYGATVIATASAAKHATVRALGADHVVEPRGGDHCGDDLAATVARLTGGRGVDLVLESVGGETFRASLAAAKRVTGRVVVYGAAEGPATISNRDLTFTHQVHMIGLHIGVLSQAAPEIYADLMAELAALIGIGVLPPGRPTVYDLADGATALCELAARNTTGKLALRP
ncbi:NADPH:quinone oxidoreductase family protein [Pseudonocardia sp. GCM10023141]|uniref:NADPH:quinone oxidoreductase family protein n=1 Tax=Pseudonocardia sp. GCM10023141 TaxID=3252653 RepID=UPI00361F0916